MYPDQRTLSQSIKTRRLFWLGLVFSLAGLLGGCPPTTTQEEPPPGRREVVTDAGKKPVPDKTAETVPEKQAEPTPEKVAEKAPDGPDLGPAAVNSRLRFKGGKRLANDLSQALSLPQSELCKELGKFDCIKMVHNITLRGVDPYKSSIYTAWKTPPVIAPIAVNRVVLSACQTRAKKDFATPDKATLFKAVAGKATPTSTELSEAVETLYKRLLLRKPTAQETKHFVDFLAKVKTRSKQPIQDWAALTCFGVGTSVEFLFY